MRLRQRIVVLLAATSACLIGVMVALSRASMSQSFSALEANDVARNVSRVKDAIRQRINDLEGKATDWSNWDDTYRFMADKNSDYIQSNLSAVSLKIDAIFYVDPEGKLFYARPLKRLKNVEPPVCQTVLSGLKLDWRAGRPKSPVSGFVQYNGNPLIVTVQPVLRSSGQGPARGWIVFCQYFGTAAQKEISDQTHLDFKLESVEAANRIAGFQVLAAIKSSPFQATTKPLDDDHIQGFAMLMDMYGQPIKMIRTQELRTTYMQGQESTELLVKQLTVAAAAFLLVTLMILEISVLDRLAKLSNDVAEVSDDTDGRTRVNTSGTDEIGALATGINSMLTNLETRTNDLRLSEGRLTELNENLERTVHDRTWQLRKINESLEFAVEGIAMFDRHGLCVQANSAFARILGYVPEELLGAKWDVAFEPEEQGRIMAAMREALRCGKSELEVRARTHHGPDIFVEVVLVASFEDSGAFTGTHVFMKDITDRKMLELELERHAFQDTVTSLPNRLLFLDRLQHATELAARHKSGLAVVFLDLDNFKIVNDSLGHEAGDCLLLEIARRLNSCLRPGDTLARWGGDEFTLLIPEVENVQEAIDVATQISFSLRTPVTIGESDVFVSVSIGIRYSDTGLEDSKCLLRDADTAMYHAKGRGKSTISVFEPHMNTKAVERLEIESGLRQALERQEFRLNYQPLISLATGELEGVEALVRWEHPTKGIIPPGLFIPVAEETGLIHQIGDWVLVEACRQAKKWHDELGLTSLTVSVNLSGRQLQSPSIIGSVTEALLETGLEPESLKLELTESVLMENIEDATAKLAQLKEIGVKIAIDDFGTGYSSMASLSNFPLDTVKIDRTFVQRLNSDSDTEPIITVIMMLTKAMCLDVTAEGLENQKQVDQLRDLGCHTGQGYFLAQPMPSKAFEDYIEQRTGKAA